MEQIRQWQKDGIKHCILLCDSKNNLAFLDNIQKEKWYPNLLLPGKNANPNWLDTSQEMDKKIYFSYPTWMSEHNEKAMEEYRRMASSYGLTNSYMTSQLNGIASTILFTEVLKKTGRNTTRSSLISEMHNLNAFETGYTAPLSYSPNKRLDSERVFIVRVDQKNKTLQLVN